MEQLARQLCRSTSWVSRRLGLLEALDAAAHDRVRAGTVPAHAAMKYLVPLARANKAQCAQLIAGLGDTPIASSARCTRPGGARMGSMLLDTRPALVGAAAAAPAPAAGVRDRAAACELGAVTSSAVRPAGCRGYQARIAASRTGAARTRPSATASCATPSLAPGARHEASAQDASARLGSIDTQAIPCMHS